MDTLKIAKVVGWIQIALTILGVVILLDSLQTILQSNNMMALIMTVGGILVALLIGIGFLKGKRWAVYLTGAWILVTVLGTFLSKVVLRSTLAEQTAFEASMNLAPGGVGLFLFAIPILLMSLLSQAINIAIFLYFSVNRKKLS